MKIAKRASNLLVALSFLGAFIDRVPGEEVPPPPTPTPFPTPDAIWQSAFLQQTPEPNEDIDAVSEGSSYYVYWGPNVPNRPYEVLRETTPGLWNLITPTPVYVELQSSPQRGFFHFQEPDNLPLAHYRYRIAAIPQSGFPDDEEPEPPEWKGGILIATRTPTLTFTRTPTPTFTITRTPTPTSTPTPRTIRVDQASTGPETGETWNAAYQTLSGALAVAEAEDVIWVAEGTYNESIVLVEGVEVYGGFDGNVSETELGDRSLDPSRKPIIDGGSSSIHIVTGVDGASLDGFIITGGAGGEFGGGIYCDATSPTFRNCIIDGNQADYGAGAFCADGGSPAFVNCVFTRNEAQEKGGAIYLLDSSPTFHHCTIANNHVQGGHCDGAYCDGSSPVFTNTILWNGRGDEVYAVNGGEPLFG